MENQTSADASLPWRTAHPHDFGLLGRQERNSARVMIVLWVTLVTMVIELLAGWYFESMALLADGWHMSSHALALGLAGFAYAASRRLAKDGRFAFGTWKIEILASFVSALLLLVVAFFMVIESVQRFFSLRDVHYPEAMAVACAGLVVNLVCAFILGRDHSHDHSHDQSHDHSPGHHHGHSHDLNLRSAYVHILTDAATSVFAIVALGGGWFWGYAWLDPAMGIVGAVVIAFWARGLLAESGRVLLDREMDHPVVETIVHRLSEPSPDHSCGLNILDLHVWRVGAKAYSASMIVDSLDTGVTPEGVRQRISGIKELVHTTIEVNHRT
jgi:cation diffusion facilitator family transporter